MAAVRVKFDDPHCIRYRFVKVGWSWTLFLFSFFAGIPLFMRGLFFRGLIFLLVWLAHIGVALATISDNERLSLLGALSVLELVLAVWIAARGNRITARRLLKRGWSIAEPRSRAAQYAAMHWGLDFSISRHEPSLLDESSHDSSDLPNLDGRQAHRSEHEASPHAWSHPRDRLHRPQRSESNFVTVLGALGSIAALTAVGLRIWSYAQKSSPPPTLSSTWTEEGFPSCGGPTARELIESALKENYLSLNLQLLDLTDIKQLAFDEKKPERQCSATAVLNAETTTISYQIWLSTDRRYLIQIAGL